MQRLAMLMVALVVALGASPAFASDPSELERLVPGIALEQDELKQFYGRGTVSSSIEGSLDAESSRGGVDLRLLMRIKKQAGRSFATPRTPSGRNATRSVIGFQLPELGLLEFEREFESFRSISGP